MPLEPLGLKLVEPNGVVRVVDCSQLSESFIEEVIRSRAREAVRVEIHSWAAQASDYIFVGDSWKLVHPRTAKSLQEARQISISLQKVERSFPETWT